MSTKNVNESTAGGEGGCAFVFMLITALLVWWVSNINEEIASLAAFQFPGNTYYWEKTITLDLDPEGKVHIEEDMYPAYCRWAENSLTGGYFTWFLNADGSLGMNTSTTFANHELFYGFLQGSYQDLHGVLSFMSHTLLEPVSAGMQIEVRLQCTTRWLP